ncbi:MAG TPA: hypothetical protein VJ844_09540, partial [Mucilaginibacter sp.]|nr:hypothetical protein [Mucilaginibacter sp.]
MRTCLIAFAFTCLYAPLHAQTDSVLVRKLRAFNQARPVEKTYLQFDKPYYAAGDTIYFKAYVTMGERHVPSRISGVLHVDLVNTKSKIDQSIKLQLAGGISWGDFALPDSLSKGNYRIRAWTQWMRNDPGSFFEKTIPVGSLQNDKASVSRVIAGKPDVQFFPEGGTLIAGIRSRIAFKAVGPNGLGVFVKGVVADNENKEITSFASVHLGMGSFDLTPEPGKTYHANLTFADRTTQAISLPGTDGQGIALSVNNDSVAFTKVRITATPAYLEVNKGKTFTLLVSSGGVATTASCTLDSAVTVLYVLKRKLFTGVATITLFSPNNEPLCERLIFVQNYDQLDLNVTTDKNQYSARAKVTLKLKAKTRADSAAMGHFSIAVIDESKVPEDENSAITILTDLLLTSDLKGYIDQPNYYFAHINDTTAKNLDLVMLTHGYRRFEWKEVLNTYPPVTFQPETGLTISGMAKSLLGQPVVHGTVSLISEKSSQLLSQTTDDKGYFHFHNLFFNDTARFVLNATKANGKNSTKIIYQAENQPVVELSAFTSTIANIDTAMMPYLENNEKQQEELSKQGLGKGRLLKEVEIKAVKMGKTYINSMYGIVNQTISGDDIPFSGNALAIRLMLLAQGVYWDNASGNKFIPILPRNKTPFSPGPMTIVWNGQEMPPGFDISQIKSPIDSVEVIRDSPGHPQGYMIFYTSGGLRLSDITSTGILAISVKGFYKARQFYAPKYEHPNDNLNRKDLRSTIYWQPELATDKDGNAEISFYNADGIGNYRVIIEGIDENGRIGRQVY